MEEYKEEKKTGMVDSVYVVKSVNIYQGEILPDDMGIGVYLTYEDAKKSYEANVLELKTLYEGNEDFDTWEEGDDEDEEFKFCIYDKWSKDSDFVALYRCEIGMWNNNPYLDCRKLKKT